jgi:hypothetical protein
MAPIQKRITKSQIYLSLPSRESRPLDLTCGALYLFPDHVFLLQSTYKGRGRTRSPEGGSFEHWGESVDKDYLTA